MKIAIIGAMQEEVIALIAKIKQPIKETYGGFDFHCGNLYHHQVVIVESGIGKVMSGILIATLVAHFPDIDRVINIGVAGGLGNLAIGDIIVGENYLYGDVDVTCFGTYSFGQIPRFDFPFIANHKLIDTAKQLDCMIADICTMDRFVVDQEYVENLIETHFKTFNIRCFDMESTAFAQSCAYFKLPFIAIRAISDMIGQNLGNAFSENLTFACTKSTEFVLTFIKKMM